ncbi:tetratricopeptide repeat protein [Roseibium sp. MMSF_3544]|nr:tetratricopeptide repeat protein [Roseibium sp. MMSF_3544]
MLTIEERLEAAQAHLEDRRHESAALIFESILDATPNNLPATMGLAALKVADGDLETAEDLVTSALARGQMEAGVLALAAKIAVQKGEQEKALALAEQALDLEDAHIDAGLIRANLLLQQGQLEQAESVLDRLLNAHPNNPSAVSTSAMLLIELGNFQPALDLLQRALANTPDNEELVAALGHCLSNLGDHKRALKHLESAHLKDPANPFYTLSLSRSLLETGQTSEALRVAKRSIIRFPDLLPAWLTYVEIMIRRGEAAAALREFTPVVRRNPDKLDASLYLAQAYRLAGYPDEAIDVLAPIFKQLDRLPPEKIQNFQIIARDCYLAVGAFENVAETFSRNPAAALATGELLCADDFFVLPPNQSNLELIPLMRFVKRSFEQGTPPNVIGPSTSGQLVDVFGPVNYLPGDLDANTDGAGLPDSRRFIPLTQILGQPDTLSSDTLDQGPYARVLEDRKSTWARSLADIEGPHIGVCWDPDRPGMLLEDFRHLFSFPKGRLVSVVWEAARSQLEGEEDIIDAGAHFRDLHDLTALLSECDLVIGPDSIPLHLAGSLGRPGIVLLTPAHPWYWHSENGRSSWYPSIRVIKTRRFGHWADILTDVAAETNEAIAELLEA